MRGVALHGLETGFWEMMTKVADRLSAHGNNLKNERTSIPITNTQRPLLRGRYPVEGATIQRWAKPVMDRTTTVPTLELLQGAI
jgi:hypothetical protein